MNLLWIALWIALGLGLSALSILLAILFSYRHAHAGSASGDFSREHYEPMARLLDPGDVAFYSQQAGVEAGPVAEMKRERRRIFRMYLRELTSDFQQLHAQARHLAAVAPEQHAGLVEALVLQQVRFWKALALVELQLELDALGIGAVKPRRLLELVGSFGSLVEQAAAAPGPVAV